MPSFYCVNVRENNEARMFMYSNFPQNNCVHGVFWLLTYVSQWIVWPLIISHEQPANTEKTNPLGLILIVPKMEDLHVAVYMYIYINYIG